MTEKKKRVYDYLTTVEILDQMAEEASELAQAALKLRRAKDKTNPTPRTEGECLDNLVEELADVLLCAIVFCQSESLDTDELESQAAEIAEKKHARWLKRLEEAHHDRTV